MLRVRILASGILVATWLVGAPPSEPDASPLSASLSRPAPRRSPRRSPPREPRDCSGVELTASGMPRDAVRLLECSSPASVTTRGRMACDALSGPWPDDGLWDAMNALHRLARIDGSGNAIPPCAWEMASRLLHETVHGPRTEPLFTATALSLLDALSRRHPAEHGALLAAFMARGDAERALVDAWYFEEPQGRAFRAAWSRARG